MQRAEASTTDRPSRSARRIDVQGLRALAVLLVVGDHIGGVPSGGFVGVDVFFVVSGYVITRLLLQELRSTGRISFTRFYARRLKRIAPASLLVLGTTLAISGAIFSVPQVQALKTDVVWAVLFGANWRSIALGTDYLHETDIPSPIQNYWSLSVEEQFYLVWPALLLLLWAVLQRRASGRTIAVALIVVTSFTFSTLEVVQHPTVAYFSTESRAWELAAGALVAQGDVVWRRLHGVMRVALAWAGLATILLTALVYSGAVPFPGPSALVPVAATAAILIAGEGGDSYIFPLTNPVSSYVGDISYSLYLWHFPIIRVVTALHPQLGRSYVLWCILLTAALSVLSYHLVETPFRHLSFRRLRSSRISLTPRRKHLMLASVGIVTVLLATGTFVTRAPLRASAAAVDLPPSERLTTQDLTPELRARTAAVHAALRATDWPEFEVPVTELARHLAPEWTRDGCLSDTEHSLKDPFRNALRCVYGNRSSHRVVAVLGDSTAASYLPGIISAVGRTWRIEVYTLAQCPAVYIDVKLGSGEAHPHCKRFQQQVAAHLRTSRPTEIVMTSSPETFQRLQSGARGTEATAEWRRATQDALHALSPASGHIVFLDPPPQTSLVQDCASPLSHPADCATSVESDAISESSAQHEATAGRAHVVVVPTLFWYCSKNGLCPPYVGRNAQTVDGRHLVDRQSRSLAPLLSAVLDPPRPLAD